MVEEIEARITDGFKFQVNDLSMIITLQIQNWTVKSGM